MRLAKKILIFIVGLCVVLALYIAIGSIDSDTFDDQGLILPIKPIPDDENGYTGFDVAYKYAKNPNFFKSVETTKKLKRHIEGEEWDPVFVEKLLQEQAGLIRIMTIVPKIHNFKLPTRKNITILDFSYRPFVDSARLLMLAGMQTAKQGDMEAAANYYSTSIKFGEIIKQEKNFELISYLIGTDIQQLTVNNLLYTSRKYASKSSDYISLAKTIDSIKPYKEDSFKYLFSTELNFILLKDRLDYYFKNSMSAIDKNLYSVSSKLLPNFYFHKNNSLSEAAIYFKKLSVKSNYYCGSLNLVESDFKVKYRWYHLILPNSYGGFAKQMGIDKDYFNRRCLAHSHFNAVKIALAMYAYRADIGEYPNDINLLIPKYLPEIPIDSFDGKPLRYSAKNKWIYSVGADFVDDGGSEKTLMRYECKDVVACMNNPTLPLE